VSLAKKAWKIRNRKERIGRGEMLKELAAEYERSVSFTTAMGKAYGVFGDELSEVIVDLRTSKLFEIIRLPGEEARTVVETGSIQVGPGRRARKKLFAIGWNELKAIVSRHVSSKSEGRKPRGPSPRASRELPRAVEDLAKVWERVSGQLERDREVGVVDENEVEAVREAVEELRRIAREMAAMVRQLSN